MPAGREPCCYDEEAECDANEGDLHVARRGAEEHKSENLDGGCFNSVDLIREYCKVCVFPHLHDSALTRGWRILFDLSPQSVSLSTNNSLFVSPSFD